MAEITLGEEAHPARVTIRLGDTLIVRLPENPAGGYRWTLTTVDSARLEMAEHRYEPTRAGVGSAGASIWTFVPKKAGRTRLELKKLRPWSPGEPAGEPFAVSLEIVAGGGI
jgi:inhibitor of cysteine peptidase